MPAHTANLQNPADVLRILLALIIEAGGELKFSAPTYDSIERGRLISLDFDRKTGQISLRATSDFSNMVHVAPEAASWTQPANVAPREVRRVEAVREAEQSSVHTDEELAEMEDKKARAQAVAKAVSEGTTPLRIRTVT